MACAIIGNLPEDVRHFVREPILLRAAIRPTLRSTVHRADSARYRRRSRLFGSRTARSNGERIFVGLWTRRPPTTASPFEISPCVRHKCRRRDRAVRASHRIVTTAKCCTMSSRRYPRDELVQTPEDETISRSRKGDPSICRIVNCISRCFARVATRFERYVSCIVYVPRDRYRHRDMRQTLPGASCRTRTRGRVDRF